MDNSNWIMGNNIENENPSYFGSTAVSRYLRKSSQFFENCSISKVETYGSRGVPALFSLSNLNFGVKS